MDGGGSVVVKVQCSEDGLLKVFLSYCPLCVLALLSLAGSINVDTPLTNTTLTKRNKGSHSQKGIQMVVRLRMVAHAQPPFHSYLST